VLQGLPGSLEDWQELWGEHPFQVGHADPKPLHQLPPLLPPLPAPPEGASRQVLKPPRQADPGLPPTPAQGGPSAPEQKA